MSTVNRLKLVLVVVGMLVFAYGMRADLHVIRWIGIAFVALAWALRFWRRPVAGD